MPKTYDWIHEGAKVGIEYTSVSGWSIETATVERLTATQVVVIEDRFKRVRRFNRDRLHERGDHSGPKLTDLADPRIRRLRAKQTKIEAISLIESICREGGRRDTRSGVDITDHTGRLQYVIETARKALAEAEELER